MARIVKRRGRRVLLDFGEELHPGKRYRWARAFPEKTYRSAGRIKRTSHELDCGALYSRECSCSK